MLRLNQESEEEDLVWKVLVYDKLGQDIISPLIKVGDLRTNGVTVHMGLYSDRQTIPDVPSVYFCEPTQENINRIAEDLNKRLYDSFYINFSSVLPRHLLEDLAQQASESAGLVSQVYDQYLNYVCLEDNLFSLQLPNAYVTINDPTSPEHIIDKVTTDIASGLFSVFVTMKALPIIRCPKGTAAEAVALKLEAKLRDNVMNSRATLFPEDLQSARPVLILLDRNMDLTPLLMHTWTYSTLVHDILSLNLNRITVSVDERGKSLLKNYDIDLNDFFWKKNAGNPFPQVAEDVDVEIQKYKEEVDQVTRSAGVSSLEEVDPNDFNASTKQLSSALKLLPELTARKKLLDMHMNIATALFKSIQTRQLDAFFRMEESVLKLSKPNVLEMLRDPAKQPEDKLRMFLIFFLAAEDQSKEDMQEYEQVLSEQGIALEALKYCKNVRMYSKMTSIQSTPQQATGSGADLLGSFTSNFSRLTDTIQNSAVSGHFESLISGVKNLLPTKRELTVTRTVDAIMDGGVNGLDDYLYLDPRLPRGQTKPPKQKTTFSEAVVFVTGGGNYLEYQNLMEFASRSLVKKKIVYGSTDLLNARKFVEQLQTLGSK
ncbi:Sec1-like protein [Gorgonomyces haynaldii]|nr:Sec1-like protein [Gorgonomyces haynaldii]